VLAASEFGIGLHITTIRTWVRTHGLGKKIGGRVYIDKEILRRFLSEGKIV